MSGFNMKTIWCLHYNYFNAKYIENKINILNKNEENLPQNKDLRTEFTSCF